jgi:succinyl-CoA synthetase beta subunit
LKLRDYNSRRLFRKYGIPIPEDLLHGTPENAYAIHVQQEMYIAITIDRDEGCPLLLMQYESGQTAEALRVNAHESSFRAFIDPLRGLHHYQVHHIASDIGLPRELWHDLVEITLSLYRCFDQCDAEFVEINPLLITQDGRLLAANGSIVVDENALYRQPELVLLQDPHTETTAERLAREAGMHGVTLDGQIGCLVNGGGMILATMDLIHDYGQADGISAANLVDIDTMETIEHVTEALRILVEDGRIQVILINIFGGLTRCDDVARGIISAHRELSPSMPFIIRLQGTNAAEGQALIEAAALPRVQYAQSPKEAAELAVNAVRRERFGNPH